MCNLGGCSHIVRGGGRRGMHCSGGCGQQAALGLELLTTVCNRALLQLELLRLLSQPLVRQIQPASAQVTLKSWQCRSMLVCVGAQGAQLYVGPHQWRGDRERSLDALP